LATSERIKPLSISRPQYGHFTWITYQNAGLSFNAKTIA
jgi:hypothetical protein